MLHPKQHTLWQVENASEVGPTGQSGGYSGPRGVVSDMSTEVPEPGSFSQLRAYSACELKMSRLKLPAPVADEGWAFCKAVRPVNGEAAFRAVLLSWTWDESAKKALGVRWSKRNGKAADAWWDTRALMWSAGHPEAVSASVRIHC